MKNKQNFISKASIAFSTLVASALYAVPVFADGDPFDTVNKVAQDGAGKARTTALIIAVLMIIIGGLALMCTENTRRWAKGHIGYVLAGVAIIVIASQLISFITTAFGG